MDDNALSAEVNASASFVIFLVNRRPTRSVRLEVRVIEDVERPKELIYGN